MSGFKTKVDLGNGGSGDNRQAKQIQFSETTLSGKTTFGVDDAYIPENFTGKTINIDAKQYIQTKGLLFPEELSKVTPTTLNTVLARNSEDGRVGEVEISKLDTVSEGTYAELEALRAANELVINNTYVLTDYKTIYQIPNTNTAPIQEEFTVNGNASGWVYFNPGIPAEKLNVGDVVTITELPSGYGGSLTVGTNATVTTRYNEAYYLFSPNLNVANLKFVTNKPRWTQIANDETITDLSGNTVMKSGGVLNTEVHNDLPYMDMTGVQNPSPKVERIALKAIASDQFSIEAESLTYIGDSLIYYFHDNEIYDENGTLIGTRNGWIQRRFNIDINIDVEIDWRTVRYRRWKMPQENWTGYTHTNSSIYQINGRNMCTIVNIVNNRHKYVLLSPVNNQFYLDYSKGGGDPFLSGTTWAPSVAASARFINDMASEYAMNVNVPYTGLTNAIDFSIMPLVNEQPVDAVKFFKINGVFDNTIMDNNTSRYGVSGDIFVNFEGTMTNNTFMTGTQIIGEKSTLREHTSIDLMDIFLGIGGIMENCHTFSFGSLNNNGLIFRTTIGGSRDGYNDYATYWFDRNSQLYNCKLGYMRGDDTTFSSFHANKVLIKFIHAERLQFTGKSYLTSIQKSANAFDSRIEIFNMYNKNPNKSDHYGYYYDITGFISEREIHNKVANKNFVYEHTDEAYVRRLITMGTAQ